jgi:hypothetical protein
LARRRRMSLLRELAAQPDRRPNADPLAEQATRIAEQTERHYALVRTHATWSFVASVAAAIMGFTVLLVALLTSDVDVAPVAAAGGILSEFLAASLFWLHHQANRHLAKVADDLRRSNARVLTAQTIAQVKDPGLKKNAQKRLIGALIEDGYLDPSWEPPAAAGAGNAPPEPPNKALKARRSA